MKPADYRMAVNFIEGKCSQYYFLDYLRTTNGDVEDAIKFYVLDDRLRSLLSQYLIRFEIQLKTDFAETVQESTRCASFWKKRKFYIPEARTTSSKGKISKYRLMCKKIRANIAHLSFSSMGPANYVAMYATSFGTFQDLFKLIDSPHKAAFIQKYTTQLRANDYRTLNGYLEAVRRIRNRCAHGNHVVTLKMVNDLNNLRRTIIRGAPVSVNGYVSVMEATLVFIIEHLNCGDEFKEKLMSIMTEYRDILVKYAGRHSLSAQSIEKVCLTTPPQGL